MPWTHNPLLPHLEAALANAAPAAGATQEAVCQDCHVLSQLVSGEAPTLHTSKEATARLTGVDSDHIEGRLSTPANAIFHLDKAARSSLEQTIAASQCKLLCYVEALKYDESAMRVTANQQDAG